MGTIAQNVAKMAEEDRLEEVVGFIEKVNKMRNYQLQYFLTKDHRALELSKKLEKKVDDEMLKFTHLNLF